MSRKVNLVIKGAIKHFYDEDFEVENIEVDEIAEYNFVDNKHLVSYEEKTENKITYNTLKFDDKNLYVIKKGYINTVFEFLDKKELRNCEYVNEYGSLNFEIKKKSLEIIKEGDDFFIDLDYDLSILNKRFSNVLMKIYISMGK